MSRFVVLTATCPRTVSTTLEGKLVGGDGSLNLDGLVVGYLMELMATHSDPSKCRKQISSFAKTLTVRVPTYLAKEIASLFRPVLYHPLMSLTEKIHSLS